MYAWPTNPIHTPSRRTQRIVRLLLADVRDGHRSHRLERIARGQIDYVVGVLAACRYVAYIFFPRTVDGRIVPCCGPTIDAAKRLGRRVLGLPVSAEPAQSRSRAIARQDADLAKLRSDTIEDAIDQIVVELSMREDLTFALAWQVPGMSDPRLDYSAALSREGARSFTAMFLREAFEMDVPRQRSGPIIDGYFSDD